MRLATAIDTVSEGLTTAGETAGFTESNALVIIENIINIVFGLLGIAALGFIIYAGYLYLTSRGEDKKVKEAKDILTYTIIGIIVIVAAWALVWFILKSVVGNILHPVTSENKLN
jgi:amino acid transporter